MYFKHTISLSLTDVSICDAYSKQNPQHFSEHLFSLMILRSGMPGIQAIVRKTSVKDPLQGKLYFGGF